MKTSFQKLRQYLSTAVLIALIGVAFSLLFSGPSEKQRTDLRKRFDASDAVLALGEDVANWANANGALPDQLSKLKLKAKAEGAFYLFSNRSSAGEPIEEIAYSCFMIKSPDVTIDEPYVTFTEIRKGRVIDSKIFSLHGAVTAVTWSCFAEKLAARKWSLDTESASPSR